MAVTLKLSKSVGAEVDRLNLLESLSSVPEDEIIRALTDMGYEETLLPELVEEFGSKEFCILLFLFGGMKLELPEITELAKTLTDE